MRSDRLTGSWTRDRLAAGEILAHREDDMEGRRSAERAPWSAQSLTVEVVNVPAPARLSPVGAAGLERLLHDPPHLPLPSGKRFGALLHQHEVQLREALPMQGPEVLVIWCQLAVTYEASVRVAPKSGNEENRDGVRLLLVTAKQRPFGKSIENLNLQLCPQRTEPLEHKHDRV